MRHLTLVIPLLVLTAASCSPDREPLTGTRPSLSVVSGPVSCDLTVKAGGGGDWTTIQDAIDAATSGQTICVYPGSYSETAANRFTSTGNGPHQFGLFFPNTKPGLTVVGVDNSGNAVTSALATQATVTTNATNNFGYSGIFVDAADITIQGLTIGPNAAGDNKTIEVIADNFALAYSKTAIPNGGGSVYLDDWSVNGDVLKAYHLHDNSFQDGTSIDIASGAGLTGPVSGREILRNVFDLAGGYWPAICWESCMLHCTLRYRLLG